VVCLTRFFTLIELNKVQQLPTLFLVAGPVLGVRSDLLVEAGDVSSSVVKQELSVAELVVHFAPENVLDEVHTSLVDVLFELVEHGLACFVREKQQGLAIFTILSFAG